MTKKEVDYKKKWENLKKRSKKDADHLRECLNSELQVTRDLREQLREKKGRYEINIGSQYFKTLDESRAKDIVRKRVLLGFINQKVEKDGASWVVRKVDDSVFTLNEFESFQNKVIALLDAEIWFFETKRI